MVDNPTYPERTDRLLDLPEARITSSRKDSLIPGIKNEHLMIAGVAVSGLLSLLALSQSQGVQNLIKRFTTKGQPVQAQQELPDNFGEPIQSQQPSRVNQPTQQQLAVINDAQQRAQAEQIAANLAAQEQLHQQAHQAQANNASMYDSIGPNTIRVDSQRGRQQYRYGSPFGANISTN